MVDQKQLVERILAGDKNTFRLLVRRYQRLVSHIVFRLIPPGPDQEDLCQEVFVKVYQHLARFRFDAKLSTWIARIAYNSCLNFLEKKRLPLYDDLPDYDRPFEPVAPDDSARPDQIYQSREMEAILRREVDRLPPTYKTIITLFHLDQMSYIEIAAIMDMPVGTIKSHLFRARQVLRKRLEATHQREEL